MIIARGKNVSDKDKPQLMNFQMDIVNQSIYLLRIFMKSLIGTYDNNITVFKCS